ncbi:Hydroxyproline-rich glycoprotein [Rhynchospora pubera]|uniref:Hydroxyproline-rich glycoprotein n=1 Tax=Rhynchospora pubera TaxID=906938 RepID=A0AAV8EJQ3_9POAL|nr:Hydroxyproline-rich glycoprotein [Rhynchospora pubera]
MAIPPFLHLFFLVSLLLSSPRLSLSQSQISLPPSLPPTSTSTLSTSDSIAPTPHLSVSVPPSSSPFASPFASPPSMSPSSSDDDLEDEAPSPSPLSSPVDVLVPVPVPAPSFSEVKASTVDTGEQEDEEKKGLDGGGKAGVVVGVFAATALVGLGVLVCKKRQENIRRSRYGDYSARVELV